MGQSHSAYMIHANEILNFKKKKGKANWRKKDKKYFNFCLVLRHKAAEKEIPFKRRRESSMSYSTVAPQIWWNVKGNVLLQLHLKVMHNNKKMPRLCQFMRSWCPHWACTVCHLFPTSQDRNVNKLNTTPDLFLFSLMSHAMHAQIISPVYFCAVQSRVVVDCKKKMVLFFFSNCLVA